MKGMVNETLREGMASVLATAMGYNPNRIPVGEWAAKRDEFLRLADTAIDYLRETVDIDPDLLAYAALQGKVRFGECIAPRDTTYDPYDAAYEACETAVKTYLAQGAMKAEFDRLATEPGCVDCGKPMRGDVLKKCQNPECGMYAGSKGENVD